MTEPPRITDWPTLRRRRSRSRRAPESFLFKEVAGDLQERIAEVNKSFTSAALVSGLPDEFAGVTTFASTVADNAELDLGRDAHDLVVHAMSLHWADDPVGQMVQSRLALRPDGLFLAALFGGQTLNELRTALSEAEVRVSGGLSPRVLPMADLRDLGGLLQRAGYAMPVADSRSINVRYRNLADLIKDLRGMAETNALAARNRTPMRRDVLAEAERLYRVHFSDADGFLRATFEIVYLTGWAPDETHPKALRPGSATSRLADALGVAEHRSGDTAPPLRR